MSSSRSSNKFRKRVPVIHLQRSPDAAFFGALRDNTLRRKFPAALAAIDQKVGGASGPKKGRLLAALGDVCLEQGKFEEAVEFYQKSAESLKDHPKLWLRPHIGIVHALLKNDSAVDALEAASRCLKRGSELESTYEQQLAAAARAVSSGGVGRIPGRPQSACAVATRLGSLFLMAGESAGAQHFLEAAVNMRPDGASTAKAGLAKLALANDDARSAYELAKDSILAGNFRTSTIPTWETLLAAKRALSQQGIEPNLIQGLKNGMPSVSSRATLLVVRLLEAEADPLWRELADKWLAQDGGTFPAVTAEIRKLRLSRAKLAGERVDEQIAAANELLGTPGLSFSEFLFATKELVRASLFSGSEVNFELLVVNAKRAYGAERTAELRHGLARSCMMARRHDLARPLLAKVIGQSRKGSEPWSKAVWALARMEKVLDRNREAADLFQQIKENGKVAERFRAQAAIEWLLAASSFETPEKLMAARPEVVVIVSKITSYELLLDLSRNLRRLKGFEDISNSAFERGAELARAAFESDPVPEHAMDTLFKLTRRQVLDFHRFSDAVTYWESAIRSRHTWLWANKVEYWEYIGFVFRSYAKVNRFLDGEALAKSMISDPATPTDGRIRVQAVYADGLIQQSRLSDALIVYRQATTVQPIHSELVTAHYWQMLEAYVNNEMTLVAYHAEMLHKSVGNGGSLLREWLYDATARILVSKINGVPIPVQVVNYDAAFLEKARRLLNFDIRKFAR